MKEIKTNGITILFVEVPEDAKEFDISDMGSLIYYVEWGNSGYIDLPQGQYQIRGKSTELSEEQMKEIIEPAKHSKLECFIDPKDNTYTKSIDSYNRPRWTKIMSTFYKNYASKQKPRSMTWLGEVDTIQESYLSLLEANGIVDRNPHGDKPSELEIMRANWMDNPISDESRKVWKWQEAQSKIKHYLVLKSI